MLYLLFTAGEKCTLFLVSLENIKIDKKPYL